MGRKHNKKLDETSDKQAENVSSENAVFRVFDMGRWKEAKMCSVCQRQFTWRKKWERCWGEVTTCSERCRQESKRERRNKVEHDDDAAVEVSDTIESNQMAAKFQSFDQEDRDTIL